MNEDRDQPHGVIEMMENDIPLAGPGTTIGQIVVFTEDVLNADETPLPLKEQHSNSLTSIYSGIKRGSQFFKSKSQFYCESN